MKLLGKTALVTGSGRGIGKGCAMELAREGADIVINDHVGSPDTAGTADEIRALGRQATVVEVDVSSRAGCEELFNRAGDAVGPIEILISNTALSMRGDFLDVQPQDFERVIQGTLTTGFHLGQLFARQCVARGLAGRVVFISSVHAFMPFARCPAYNAAKAGLNHLAASMASELSAYRIRVNTIEPGAIDTPGERITFGEQRLREIGASLPWKRMGTPEDIGRAAVFLVSDDADYVTGAVLRVDGGFWFKDVR